MSASAPKSIFRFADFELDTAAYTLRRKHELVRLERRPMDLLILLLEHSGQLVSRDDIVERLWGRDVFVDVELGINTAVRKIRQVLHDGIESPKFLETVSGKGYRFIAEVRRVDAAPQAVSGNIALAVLPFENLGLGEEREYLADGMTEEAIVAIGQIEPERLTVIGRTSVMSYKKTRKTLAEIGNELGVAYIVEGSVRAEGERMRTTARLIRVSDQAQMWSASFDSESRSTFAMQSELSTAIAEQIRLRLSPQRLSLLARRQTHNAEAYDLYLRGRYYWNQLTLPTTRRAMEYFTRAVQLDDQYALAWSGIADALSASPISGDARPLDVWARAAEAAAQAVHSESDLAETQTSLAFMNIFIGWDWAAAERALHTAIELDANYPLAHRLMGVLLGHMGRHEEAAIAIRRARELDPLYAMHHALSAQVACMGRDFHAAARFARQSIIIDPEFWIGHLQLGQALEQQGDINPAIAALNEAARLSGGNSKALSYKGHLLATAGQIEEARQIVAALELVAHDRYMPACAIALVYAGLGERELALEWLERGYKERDVHLIFLPVDCRWDALRAEPRFQAIINDCGFVIGEERPILRRAQRS